MSPAANGTFELKDFDETQTADLGGGSKVTRATITRALSGDVEGEAVWETVMYYRPDGTATIVGLERVTGSVGGRRGGYVAETTGTFDGTEMRSSSRVIEGSGTEGLTGLRGTGSTAAPHGPTGSYTLDHELPGS
jgi:Protein of unknown function (DUF3224)